MDDRIYIGIGCLFLGSSPDKLNTWKQEVSKLLDSVPGISHVEVQGVGGGGYVVRQGLAVPINFEVSFDLEIPFESQEQLIPDEPYAALDVDLFRVVTHYEYDGPVTYVLIKPPAELPDSSASVRIVREYLTKFIDDRESAVSYAFLGPSPFHAEVSLAIKEEQSERFVLKRTPSPAYDSFEFTAAGQEYGSSDEALEAFLEELTAELSVYYRLVAEYYERIRVREEISVMTWQLLSIYEHTGPKAWLLRVLTSASKMRRLALRSVKEIYDNQAEYSRARKNVDEVYDSGAEPFFKAFLDSRMAENFQHDLSAARDIASLLNQAREQQVQTLSLFLSALAGGLAGALVSLLIH